MVHVLMRTQTPANLALHDKAVQPDMALTLGGQDASLDVAFAAQPP
jgi:hypothetical protein